MSLLGLRGRRRRRLEEPYEQFLENAKRMDGLCLPYLAPGGEPSSSEGPVRCNACSRPVHSTLTDQCPHCGAREYGR